MLVSQEQNQHNRNLATGLCVLLAAISLLIGWFEPVWFFGLAFCPLLYWLLRRKCLRRLASADQPWPASWETILHDHVAFFRALSPEDKERFRRMIKVFLDEVRITGVRTQVDDTVRVLVAASAAIPVFGFQDWEYSRLREVLIYPDKFGETYKTTGNENENILGMVGTSHLNGVMILSKPSLLEGFDNPSTTDHVGIHEFVHLVENQEVNRGLPAEVPLDSVQHWVRYVARELAHPTENHQYINSYAYTNEHEFLAVLAEYFFKSPRLLKKKDPRLYNMLRDMFHQDMDNHSAR